MKELTLLYTNIQHSIRRELDISCLEYALVDMIYHLSTKPDSAVIGWCYKSKDQLALEIGITKQGLLKMIDRLILCGLLEKNAETRYLKTTEKYFGKLFTDSKQSLPKGGKQSLPLVVNKVDPIIITNKNTNYNSFLPEEKKDEGFDLAGKERLENPMTPYEKSSFSIEETKDKFINDESLLEPFARATKKEKDSLLIAIDLFVEHTVKNFIKYPRPYDKTKDCSKKHFVNWIKLQDAKIFEPKPIIIPKPPIDESELKRQSQVVRDKQDAFTEKLRLKKIENDRQEDEKRESNKTGLRKISSNLSAQSVPSYLLSGA